MAQKTKGIGCFGWSAIVITGMAVLGYFLPDTPDEEAATSEKTTSNAA